jgi:hypothetical protein
MSRNDEKRENSKTGYVRDKNIRGDSLDQHQKVEEANQYLSEGEISQQNNNL